MFDFIVELIEYVISGDEDENRKPRHLRKQPSLARQVLRYGCIGTLVAIVLAVILFTFNAERVLNWFTSILP